MAASEQLAHLGFPPDACGARDEAGRVDEMGRAALVHPDGGVREALGELTDAARVIQMDMGQHDVGELAGGHPERAERRGDRFDGRARSGLDQCRLRGLEEVGGGVASSAPHERVDRRDAVGDGEDDGR
jgi:hypothetical protein